MVSTAARVGSINVLLSTQLGPGMAGLNAFAGAVDRTGSTVARSVAGMDRSIGGLNRSMGNMNTRGMTSLTLGALRAGTAINQLQGIALAAGVAVGGLFPAAIAAGMIRTVDGAHRLSNQLRTVTTDANDLKDTQQALYEVAQRSRSSFDGTVTIYARTARAVEHLNMKQKDLLRMTETVQKAFSVGGATTAEAWGGAVQLSQGIASNRFSGDEFRSVAENAPVLLQGMAKNLGVTIGKLREMAHAGQLTADVVTRAIIGASQDIDEAFAKTTSTIEQAWVRVGNAVTKYAMDSEKASAGSKAIVGSLNFLTDNLSGTIDIVLALGAALAATFAARRMQAVTGWVSGLKAASLESLAVARANEELARTQRIAAGQDFIQKRLAFNKALADGTLTAKQLERQKKSLTASSLAYRAAVDAQTNAVKRLAIAQGEVSKRGMALAAVNRAWQASLAFVGGPLGAALIALSGVMILQARNAAFAEAAAAEYGEAIKKAGEESNGAAGGIRAASAELSKAALAAGDAAKNVSLANAQATFEDSVARMRALASSMRGVIDTAVGFNSMTFSPVASEVDGLVTRFEKGEISAEELRSAIDKIAAANPDNSAVLARIQEIGDIADASRGRVDALIGTLEQLQRSAFAAFENAAGFENAGVGKKGDRPRIPSEDEFNSRFGGRYADPWKKLFPDLYKKEKQPKAPRKSADDRFDNSVQSLRDRGDELDRERESLNLNYAEQLRRQESLKLEQEALKQVREEARRNNQENWQSIELSQEHVDRIKEEVDAYVEKAMALKEAREEQEAWNQAASASGDLLRGMIDGTIEWKDALVEAGKIALKLLNDLAKSQGSKGIFGGGFFQNLLGGLLGISFHSGGTVGAGGARTAIPLDAPFAGVFHGGGNFGGRRAKHDEVMALVQKHENIFTDSQTDKVIGALSASASRMKERDYVQEILVRGVFVDDGGVVHGIADSSSAKMGAQVARAVPSMALGAMDTGRTRRTRTISPGGRV